MPTPLERLQYGYDRDSRRVWRRRALAEGEDNHYGYDGLSQVTASALGNLNLNQSAIAAVPAQLESFDYDPTGNWRGYTVEADGAVSLEQHRVHDKGNRLTQIEDEESPILLDQVGRMTEMAPDASGDWNESLQLKWDAWSRVTEVRRASDDEVLGSYTYDGLTRRITRTVAGTTVHSYYSDSWRPLEERKDDESTASAQYFWGARHRDDLVRRDRDTTGGGTLDETRYVLMDYFSPASITDESGTVTERYAFSAFGVRRILAPDFSPRSSSECGFEFAFQGQFLDTESGLLNYGYRYYSPFLGRWTAKDPIRELGGLNLYSYATNNATNRYDLYGLKLEIGGPGQGQDCIDKINKAIQKIEKCGSKRLKDLLNQLRNSTRTHRIVCTPGANTTIQDPDDPRDPDEVKKNGDLSGSQIAWNPDNSEGGSPEAQLTHELEHSFQRDTGYYDKTEVSPGVPANEADAVRAENDYRQANGEDPRTTYGSGTVPNPTAPARPIPIVARPPN